MPKVLVWEANAENPVISEYIIMEEAEGTQLGEIWDDMGIDEKNVVVSRSPEEVGQGTFQSVSQIYDPTDFVNAR